MTQTAPNKDVTKLEDIPGWFPWIDQRMFEHYLDTKSPLPGGDVVELGVYMGRSAVLLGRHIHDGETLYVCDLFGTDSDDDANQRENDKSYKTLNRAAFESNYLALHPALPVVIEGLSSVILEHVKPDTARFVHVDASHLYDHVLVDLESARTMLKPGGVVCFDDYRSSHTPGVSAVVWGAVGTGDLHAIAVTPQKLYATFDADVADTYRTKLREWVDLTPGVNAIKESIHGELMWRLWNDPPKRTAPPTTDELITKLSKDVAAIESRLDKHLDVVDKRTRIIERLVRANGPSLATKVVRKVRAARTS